VVVGEGEDCLGKDVYRIMGGLVQVRSSLDRNI